MSFKSLGVIDNQIIEKFDRLVEKYYSTKDQDDLDTVAYGICEEIKELREVLTHLDKKYTDMENHGHLAAEMSQRKGTEAKRLQRQVSELMRQNGDLKRRINLRVKVHQ